MEEAETEQLAPKSTNPSFVGIAVILIIVIGGFVYLTQKPSESKSLMGESVTPSAAVSNAPTALDANQASPAGEVVEKEGNLATFNLESGAYYFKPAAMTLKKGDQVKITLTSIDMPHDFVIDELNVKSDTVSKGKTTTIEFTADKVGKFEYYCSVGNHRAMGMVGTLTVTE